MFQFRPQATVLQTTRQWRSLLILLLTLVTLFAARPVNGVDFFISPEGNDNNDGSIDNPLKTIDKALEQVQAGDTIFLRGGVHDYSQTIRITKSGEPERPIILRAYADEVPILDFQEQVVGSAERGIHLTGSYWHLKGFTIQNAGDNGLNVGGSHNVMEQLITRYNADSGLQLHTGASYNLILNCDSYFNYDPQNHGENADGFAAKFNLGPGNTFIGCRAWSNSDDGYDFWEAGNGVTVENCWAFRNGVNIWGGAFFSGDGNGFKLGHGSGGHVLIWCLAYDHPHHGIDVNGNETGVMVYNCTCVMNGGANFFFDDPHDTHVLRNNLSYLFWEYIVPEVDDQYNSWNGFSVGAGDFESLDPTGIDGQREADGGLPKLSFLRLSARSPLIDAGIYMELPFHGDAPDLGAFEHLEGDCVPDGYVDLYDLECLASNWLYIDCGDCNGADFDGNGKVDLYDFSKLAGNWLK